MSVPHYEYYVRARERQLDYFEELLIIEMNNSAKDGDKFAGANHVARSRLKIDTLKFILGKLRAHKWGEKLEVTVKQEPRIFNI